MDLVNFLLVRIVQEEANAERRGQSTERRGHTADQMLRDAQIKRKLIHLHAGGGSYRCPVCFTEDATGALVQQPVPCETLRILALAYVDHPDYRDEWRP